MADKKPSPLALEIAKTIKAHWSIGTSSNFCDEVDWDDASVEEIAEVIDEVLEEHK